MSKENNINKGMLSKKMSNFHAEPPADAWNNIASRLSGGSSSRKVFLIVFAAAAGLALAITVGVKLIDRSPEIPMADNQFQDQAPAEEAESRESIINEIPVEDKEYLSNMQEEGMKPSRLEEKVLIALEEVIKEIENDPLVTQDLEIEVLAEQTDGVEGIFDLMKEEQNLDTIVQNDMRKDQAKDPVDQQVSDANEDQQEIDQAYSERYLDSISESIAPEDEIITAEEKERNRWQLGAALTPLFSYRDASSPNQAQNMAANNSESGVIAYSGGIQVSYAQSDRLSFESGLYYNKMGLAIGDFNTYSSRLDFMIDNVTYADPSVISMTNSIGTISITSREDIVVNTWANSDAESFSSLDPKEMKVQDEVVNSFEQSLEYLEIPFNVKYKILDKDLKVLLVGGISTNLLVGNQAFANTENGKLNFGSIQDIRTVNYSGNAGLGFVYEFPGNFSLSLEPRFRYYINSINTESLPATRPYTLGVYTGLNYTF